MTRPTRVSVSCPLPMPDGDGCEGELVVLFTPGFPGSRYGRGGDPGDPPEPPEIECDEGTCAHAGAEWSDAEYERVLRATETALADREQDAYDARGHRRRNE